MFMLRNRTKILLYTLIWGLQMVILGTHFFYPALTLMIYRYNSLYSSDVRDTDLYVGAMLEKPVPGGQVGPTFACLLAEQFHDLKVGDKFWYERNDSCSGFTEGNEKHITFCLFVCLFCCFTSQVNSYGHCGTVSSPNHTFYWAGLNKRLTSNSCTYFRL